MQPSDASLYELCPTYSCRAFFQQPFLWGLNPSSKHRKTETCSQWWGVPNGRMLQRPGVAILCCSGAHSTSWLEIWQPAPFAEECWLFPEGNKEKALNEMILWSVYEGWTACTLPIIPDKGRGAINACAFILRYQNDDFSGIAKKWMLQRNAKEKMA